MTLQQQNCNCGIAAILEEVEKDGMVNGKTNITNITSLLMLNRIHKRARVVA